MKRGLLFFVFLFILPIVFAQGWVFNSEYIDLNLDISSRIVLAPSAYRYSVEYVIANLSFMPKDGFQEKVLGIETEPFTEVKEGSAVFRWDNPAERELRFSIKSDVRSFNKVVEIRDKISFPLEDLPDDVKAYTKPSETIDSDNEDIIRLASEIVKGEDDLYIIVFGLGEWTKRNIKYDLSTLTEGVSQKASWVLRNREGVCDELTNLFIAMNRALGIPARFVSGIAYTNAAEFEEGFGPHGWAEIYFPGYEWVPFDVTYGEFGFVDSSHVKLKESFDANEASTQFRWSGENIDIKTYPLDIKSELKETKFGIEDTISINARAIKDNIGFGSYNLIEADIKNLMDYYAAAELSLSKPKEIEIIGENKKAVLLKPNEGKKVNWIVKVSDSLERGYLYTFPFVVSSLRNVSSSIRFDVVENGKEFSLEGIEELIGEKEDGKTYSGNVELRCKADNEEIYEYENTTIVCNAKNIGNVYLEDLNVCLDDDCKKFNLGITQENQASFGFKPQKIGAQEVIVKASNKDASKSAFLDITVYDAPSIEINDLVYPQEVRYKDIYEISFLLSRKSRFDPYNISIMIEPLGKRWDLNKLNEDRKVNLKMYGSELKAGENRFKISIEYKDKRGKSYSTSKEFTIGLVEVNIFQRIILFFKHLF